VRAVGTARSLQEKGQSSFTNEGGSIMKTLAPHRPFDLLSRIAEDMNEFRNWFQLPSLAPAFPARALYAPYDLEENDNEFVVRMDVPGMAEKDIKVVANGGALTISGERKEEKTETKGNVTYSERQYGSFTRSIALPANIKTDAVRAQYKEGVLEVHLPKAQKSVTKEIKIEH
jgi:HSP20 family protein